MEDEILSKDTGTRLPFSEFVKKSRESNPDFAGTDEELANHVLSNHGAKFQKVGAKSPLGFIKNLASDEADTITKGVKGLYNIGSNFKLSNLVPRSLETDTPPGWLPDFVKEAVKPPEGRYVTDAAGNKVEAPGTLRQLSATGKMIQNAVEDKKKQYTGPGLWDKFYEHPGGYLEDASNIALAGSGALGLAS